MGRSLRRPRRGRLLLLSDLLRKPRQARLVPLSCKEIGDAISRPSHAADRSVLLEDERAARSTLLGVEREGRAARTEL